MDYLIYGASFGLKPVCRFERWLLDSRNHVSLRLIILSRVLQEQLVKAMGSITGRVFGIFCFLRIGMVTACFHIVGMLLRDPYIVVYI